MAVTKQVMDKRPDLRGPIFWTKLPKKPADRPRKRMAREKVHVVSLRVNPIDSMMGLVRTLQA